MKRKAPNILLLELTKSTQAKIKIGNWDNNQLMQNCINETKTDKEALKLAKTYLHEFEVNR